MFKHTICFGFLLLGFGFEMQTEILASCNCKNLQTFNESVSNNKEIIKSYSLTQYIKRKSIIDNSEFDQKRVNQAFFFSFQNIPFLCDPVLTIVVKPLFRRCRDNNGSCNDSISLQSNGRNFRWSKRFSKLFDRRWQGVGWQEKELDLDDLSGGGVDLSMDLVTGRLDIYIQDDTAVQSLTLSGQVCSGPGISRSPCCGDGTIAWTESSHMFAFHTDGNIKRFYWQEGGAAQWIQTVGTSPIVPGSFVTFDQTSVLVVNEKGEVIHVSPSGSKVIPNTEKIHPCSLVVTSRGIYGVRSDNGDVILMNLSGSGFQSATPWDSAHRPVESSLIEFGDGRVAGVTQHGYPWNVYFDDKGVMQWATIGEIGRIQD